MKKKDERFLLEAKRQKSGLFKITDIRAPLKKDLPLSYVRGVPSFYKMDEDEESEVYFIIRRERCGFVSFMFIGRRTLLQEKQYEEMRKTVRHCLTRLRKVEREEL